MKKKLTLILALALALSLTLLAGCGGSGGGNSGNQAVTDNANPGGDVSTDTPDTSGGDEGDRTITIGASFTPHAEILEQVLEVLGADGWTLKIVIYDDYVLPNTALNDGTIDANYFQHTPYLDSFNSSNGTDLYAAALIHYEPFGVYGNGVTDIGELEDGATIIIPADDSNETRALLLLQQEGLITLPEGASAADGVSTLDIIDNGGYNIVPVEASTVAAQFKNSDEGTIAVINGNYALAAGLDIADALASEDASGDAAQTYANIIACRAGDEESAKIKALVAALQTDEVADYIEETYKGAVVAIF